MSLSTTQYGYIVDPMVPFTDDKGKTIKNGFIRVFMAGTSTPVLTYRNYDGATNQEKIELDNSGRVKHNVIGSKGSLYKVVVYNILHSQENPLLTVDKIAVLGASINASGATIVTGLDSVTVQDENFLKATVEGTGVELALDPTEVTSEVSTIAAAATAAPDYVVPLLDKTGEGDSKKISLANLFKFALDWISRLATTITSFASGDYFAVSNTTNGARKMSKDTLLQITAQNTLAGNVAQAFIPSSEPNPTTTVAGQAYVYGGLLYVAKVSGYQGEWDATKFFRINSSDIISTLLNLNDGYWWKVGTRHTSSGIPLYQVTNAIFTDLLSFNKLATISLSKAEGVSFNLTLFAFDKDCKYLGYDNTSGTLYNLASILNAYPSAKFVSVTVNSIVGATVDLEDLSNIVTFNDVGKTIINAYVNPYAFKDLANRSENALTFSHDLNDPKYWLVRGLNASGYVDNDNEYHDRITSVLLPLTDDTKIQYSTASGVTLYERIYAYNKSGVYLGYVQSASYISAVKYQYPTAYYYRIYLYGISGTTAQADSIANIATFDNQLNKVVGVEKNSWLGEVTGDRVRAKQIGEKRSIRHLCNKTTLPCFSFTFDGPYPQDKEVVDLFDSKGVRCGFAFVASDYRLQFYTEEFLKYQSRGYEIINHNLNAKRITTEDYASYDLAYADLLEAKELLVNRGFVVNGFIAPRSVISDAYKSIIGKLHAYGFIGNAGANDPTSDVCLLDRYGLETPTEQTIKDFIDDCIANNKYCCLYAHTNNFGVGDFSLNKVKNILEYVIAKRDAGLCTIDIPTEMVAQYFSLN